MKMGPGLNPEDLIILDKGRDYLEDMGQTMHGKRGEDIFLQGLPAEYDRVQNIREGKRDFGLDDILQKVHTINVESLSRSLKKPAAGRGIVK